MIAFKLQLILLALSVSVLLLMINMIRKYKLELKYALLWILLDAANIALAADPGLAAALAEAFGIETPVNALFLLGIFASLVLLFGLTVALSRSSNKLKNVSQQLGLLRQELDALKTALSERQSPNEQ